MELINKQYIKVEKFSIFMEIVRASDEQDEHKLNFFQNLLNIAMDYEKANRRRIDSIYIRISDLIDKDILRISEIPINRQTIMNAALFAIYNNDLNIAKNLNPFFEKYETKSYELGELSDYVLEYGIDMFEYFNNKLFNRPSVYIIYNEIENKLEEGYIYSNLENPKNKKLELK